MYDKGVITISDFQKGVAQSPLQGFSVMRNVDVFDSPAICKISSGATLSQSRTGLMVASVKATDGSLYTLFDDGKLYRDSTTSISTALTGAQDMVEFKDYLIISYGSGTGSLAYYGPLSGAATFSAGWQTGLTGDYWKKMIVAQDDVVYIANGNTIAKLSGTVPSPTFNTNVLDLPTGYYVSTFAELGKYLMIGTHGGASYSDGSNFNIAKIFPWDRSSSSFNLPVNIEENGIQAMLTKGNRLYVVAGTRGNIYESDISSYRKIARIPFNQDRVFGTTLAVYPNAFISTSQGTLLVGTSTSSDSFPTKSTHGVWEISLSEKYPVALKNTISTGNYGTTQTLRIGALVAITSGQIFIGWQDGSTYGIDEVTFRPVTSYGAVIESPVAVVGGRLSRKSFQHLEFQLLKPLTTGQGIRIGYRKNLTDDYTTIGTFTYASLGAVISHETKALIDDAELVQVKIELTAPSDAAIGTNVELLAVRIW